MLTVASLYRTNPIAKSLFDHLARLRRLPSTTTVMMVRRSSRCSKRSALELMGELAELGLGTFCRKRGKDRSRIEWVSGAFDQVRAAVTSEHGNQITAPPSRPPAPAPAPAPVQYHSFTLRPNFRIRLPTDLTTSEAISLAVHILSLPRDDSQGDGIPSGNGRDTEA